ncbi:Uncharacterised protein [Vibrio cholerae]|nr:Uncharacterised protein [Vibrio cholerae]
MAWTFCFNTRWQLVLNRVRETQSQAYSVAFHSSTVTNTLQNEFLSKAFSNTNNHILNKSTCSTCLCPCIGYAFTWTKSQLVVFLCDHYTIVENAS